MSTLHPAGAAASAPQKLLSGHRPPPPVLDLGRVRVTEHLLHGPGTIAEPCAPIVPQPVGTVHVWLPVHGTIAPHRTRLGLVATEGDVLLLDSAQCLQAQALTRGPQPATALLVQFPRAVLPVHHDTVHRLAHRPICARSGPGALLRHYLSGLVRYAPHYQIADAPRLAAITLELLGTVLSHEARQGGSPEPHRLALQQRIVTFIEERLGERELTPPTIAAAHQISVRYLHKLFHDHGMSVADRIRHLRMERIHRDLADPRLDDIPIHAIAARWGFPDPAHLCRAFRTAYGMAPSTYRHQAGRGETVHGFTTVGP
ncbi:helix-turn-helix transcriptional regulator [Streptomyces sp. NPDC006733]|uniref:helix-turn-helix transcriptional regulator n=1 Tax=Streptomyces sp. NPDC006733 TaxID=3155460 RepID=UPI0033F09042